MTITITGSKYSGSLTSVGTTTLTNSGASFSSGDFTAQRIVGLWNSAGTTYKGVAWVRRWVSATQLELERPFVDEFGTNVTQVSGDTYLVSKNWTESVVTGIAVSGSTVTLTDTLIVFGTASSNSVCFYDEAKTHLEASGQSYRFDGGLVVFGHLLDYANRLADRGCFFVGGGSTAWYANSTVAQYWVLGANFVQLGRWGSSSSDTGSAPNWSKLWNTQINGGAISGPSAGGNWAQKPNSQEVLNTIIDQSALYAICSRWGDGRLENITVFMSGSAALSIFGSDVAGTFNISSPAGTFITIYDCGYGGTPAFWRCAGFPNQTINLTNVVTPNRIFGTGLTPNSASNYNATGNFFFSGLYTGLINSTLALVKNNNLLSTVQSSTTVSNTTATLTIKEATISSGYLETVTENSWGYGFYFYGYVLVSGTFATATQALNGGQIGKIVKFGGFAGQILDVNISQATVATVAAYTALNTFDQLYDYAQYWKALSTTNAIYPAYNQQLIASSSGVLSTPTPLNVKIDTAATFNATNFVNTGTGTITIKPTTAIASGTKADTFQLSAGKTLTFAQNGDKSGAIYLIPATGVVVVPSGATILTKSVFTSGATINVSSGSATVTVDSTSGITAGSGVTLTTPSITYIRSVSGAPVGSAVFLGKESSVQGIVDRAQFTLATGNNSGNSTVVISGSIPADTPASGFIRLVNQTTAVEVRYAYTGWSGSTFALSGILAASYASTDTVYVGYLDVLGSSTGNEAVSLQYVADRACVLRIRLGSGSGKIQEFSQRLTLTNTDKPISVSGIPDLVNTY